MEDSTSIILGKLHSMRGLEFHVAADSGRNGFCYSCLGDYMASGLYVI